MLHDDCAPMGEMASAKMERCKPDYEKIIAGLREQRNKSEKFLDAIYEYNGNSKVRNKMAELVGELHSEIVQLNSRIEIVIKQQEEDTE